MVHAVDSKSTGGNTLGVRVPPPAPKCVDERCNAENAARKCGVFTYNALLLEQKGCKNSIFQNSSFAPARGDIFNALPDLWSGVVRTPRLKNKENQQPLYPSPCGRFSFVPQESMKGKAKSIMKLKRNSLTTLLVVSLLLMALSGCGQQAEPDSAQPPLETVTYSNLTDADSRKLLTEALADANVDETRTKLLLDRVDQFNASVKSEWLTGGFESAAPTETRYDPYEMQDLWTEKNGSFPGYNCRITAFSLFGEFVTAGADQPETQGEDSLFMDLETLAADPAVLCGDSTSKFCALFAPVTAADTTEVADQVKALRAGWSERGISFEDSSARLISVVLHDRFSDTDNTLFIGHVGVLLPAEDGSLYFIEKVAFQEPYRLVKIQNRTELSDYLMEKYDTAWGQDTTRPFIMENDELMDGYRPNPLDSAS